MLFQQNKIFSWPVALILTGLFLVLALLVQLHHEMWRDELHSWVISRDSDTIPELLNHKRHEGHPGLWYITLFSITRVNPSPEAMQRFHLVVASISILLLLKFSPFRRGEKLLLLLNYYLFYEYGVISRNYALGILFFFLFCALGPRRKASPGWAAGCLFLVMQTSFHGLVLGLLGAVILIQECRFDSRKNFFRQLRVAVPIVAAGIAVSLWVMVPPPDCGIYTGGHGSWDPERIVRISTLPWRSILPFPFPARSFWNTNLLDPWRGLQAVLSVLLLVWLVLSFWRRRVLGLVFLAGTLIYLMFHYLKFYGYSRHHGHIFILFLGCLWLAGSFSPVPLRFRGLNRICSWAERSLSYLFPFILLVGAVAGVYSARKDWKYPFSDNLAAVNFIRESGLDQLDLAGDVDDATLVFPILLDKKIYYPRSDTEGTFVTYDRTRRWRKMRYWEILGRLGDRALQGKDILLILNYDIPDTVLGPWQKDHPPGTPGHLEYLARFDEGIVPDEHYRLFRIIGGSPFH